MVDITITTPTIRPEMMEVVAKSLARQNFKGTFEWLVGAPAKLESEFKKVINIPFTFLPEPPKKNQDFYSLNKCWNELFKHAKGELIVNIVDGIWFNSDVLTNVWNNYQANKQRIVGGIGHQYEQLDDHGKPTILVWRDPRAQTQYGSFWEINPQDMEWCLVAIPKKAIYDVGGIDSDVYDTVSALSEKDANLRMDRLGYTFWLDNSLEYFGLRHERIGGKTEWDKHYFAGCKIFAKHLNEIQENKRLKLNYLKIEE